MVAYWEKCALANAQEETRQESTDKVMGDSSQGSREAPKSRENGEVYGGFSEVIEEHVPISLSRRSQKKGPTLVINKSRTREPAW